MATNPTYPGVYVQEVPSGVRSIAGVSTSTALFIGEAASGPLETPVRLASYADFAREFGENRSSGQMADYVRLFFQNGGSDAYVMRIADGAPQASVDLVASSESLPAGGTPTISMSLKAKAAGLAGESIRVEVSYPNHAAGHLFNMTLYRREETASGRVNVSDREEFRNLSMNPDSGSHAPTILTQRSKLVEASATAPTGDTAYSVQGRSIEYTAAANFGSSFEALLPADGNRFVIRIDGQSVEARVTWPASLNQTNLVSAIESAIVDAATAQGVATTGITVSLVDGYATTDLSKVLRFESTNFDISLHPAPQNDIAAALGLGTAQGGYEIGRWASARPMATGISILSLSRTNNVGTGTDLRRTVGDTLWDDLSNVELDVVKADGSTSTVPLPIVGPGGEPIRGQDSDDWDGVREFLNHVAGLINSRAKAEPRDFPFEANVAGMNVFVRPSGPTEISLSDVRIMDSAGTPAEVFDGYKLINTDVYAVGASGGSEGGQVSPPSAATEGGVPSPTDYDAAYRIAESEIDLFNLLVLPPRSENNALLTTLYGAASAFCEKQRAFLIMDPPDAWTEPQAAADGVNAVRVGVSTDHSACFYPRLRIFDGELEREVGAAGAIAGLMARIDAERGVWKAPAGTEANILGVTGTAQKMSDTQNGWINQRGLNGIRVFPNGVVNWGARTLDGDNDFASEWKYIPIRRLALYVEESLYRGLKWTVFEPNGEGLWAQIRLNVGSFMHGLYRQGAFAGTKPNESYFVSCDKSTTTPTDQRLGIVNIDVGFAPLNPAEFVILRLQQMTSESSAS